MAEQKNPGDSTDFLVPQVKTPAGCVVNRDPRVLIHGRDILTVSLTDAPYGGTKAE